jgi:hypothetical protein
MLNELFAMERGLAAAGVSIGAPHPDVKDVGRGDVLRLRLSARGEIHALEPIALDSRVCLWTLRDGQHNSFPYVKNGPLLLVPDDDAWRREYFNVWKGLASIQEQRLELRRILCAHGLNVSQTNNWPGAKLKQRVRERLALLDVLRRGDAAAVPAVFERFLVAIATPERLLTNLAELLISNAERRDESWVQPAYKAFVEGLPIYFDVPDDEFDRDAGDRRQVAPVSSALSATPGGRRGICALQGIETDLHEGNFPQPNLRPLGPTYIFAKNTEIPAAERYGRSADTAISVGRELTMRLAGSITALTAPERKDRTWALIPSEKPKQSDLLLAFLPSDPELAIVELLANSPDAEKAYEELPARVIDELRGRVTRGIAKEQEDVLICILRKVDPANRKVIYHRSPSSKEVHDAALRWRSGCRNVPSFLTLPVPDAGKVRDAGPPHVPPTSLPSITRVLYASGGTRRVEVIGRPAAEAFALFLDEGNVGRRAHDLMRVFLTRHGVLLAECAHARRRGFEHVKAFDRAAALKSITWLGLLLHKLDRSKEVYMSDPAFKLGQLLAVADAVHAGYCADVRQGDMPPTLLGNSVLSMAQTKPIKALAVLCGRWKPYGAWAKRVTNARKTADRLVEAKTREDQERGWAIRRALSQASRASEISAELSQSLPESAHDAFRAELLLGYIAGLPKNEKTED